MAKSFLVPHPAETGPGKLQGSASAAPHFAMPGDRKIFSGCLQIFFRFAPVRAVRAL
jgi:hypothetical protein